MGSITPPDPRRIVVGHARRVGQQHRRATSWRSPACCGARPPSTGGSRGARPRRPARASCAAPGAGVDPSPTGARSRTDRGTSRRASVTEERTPGDGHVFQPGPQAPAVSAVHRYGPMRGDGAGAGRGRVPGWLGRRRPRLGFRRPRRVRRPHLRGACGRPPTLPGLPRSSASTCRCTCPRRGGARATRPCGTTSARSGRRSSRCRLVRLSTSTTTPRPAPSAGS